MSRRSVVIVVTVVVVGLLAAVGGIALWQWRAASGPECSVPRPPVSAGEENAADDVSLELTAVSLQHASTINAVGLARGMPARARVIALATAWQESSLRNIDYGDRDSLGLFQQRPSQGWGEPDQVMDPVFAAGAFYDALAKVPDWQEMSLTQAAQAVQRSGHPNAYAKWETDAQTLAYALGGTGPVTLSCRRAAAASTAAAPVRLPPTGTDDASPQLRDLLAAAAAEFGVLDVIHVGDDGRAAQVTTTLPTLTEGEAARALAARAVAHATSSGVSVVTVADRTWSRHQWSTGQTEPAMKPGTVMVIVTEQ